jgi:hypothetical protein
MDLKILSQTLRIWLRQTSSLEKAEKVIIGPFLDIEIDLESGPPDRPGQIDWRNQAVKSVRNVSGLAILLYLVNSW